MVSAKDKKELLVIYTTFYLKIIDIRFTDFRLLERFGDKSFIGLWNSFITIFPGPNEYATICEEGLEELFWSIINTITSNHLEYFVHLSPDYFSNLLHVLVDLLEGKNTEAGSKAIKYITKFLRVEELRKDTETWAEIEDKLWTELIYQERYTIIQ